jgi:uncharacterized protein (TIGR03382 family)
MQRLILVLSVVVGAWLLSPTPEAQAWSWSSWSSSKQSSNHRSKGGKSVKGKGNDHKGKGQTTVPELDPSAAGSAMVLLLGGMAWIASRRRDEELA